MKNNNKIPGTFSKILFTTLIIINLLSLKVSGNKNIIVQPGNAHSTQIDFSSWQSVLDGTLFHTESNDGENRELPDSIIEMEITGFDIKYSRWYCLYNSNSLPDTAWMHKYDDKNNEIATTTWKYDSLGNEIEKVEKMVFSAGIATNRYSYRYLGGKVIWEYNIIRYPGQGGYVYEKFYRYDDAGNLVADSIKYGDNYRDPYYYSYDSLNRLEYSFIPFGSNSVPYYSVKKCSYGHSDSSRLYTEKFNKIKVSEFEKLNQTSKNEWPVEVNYLEKLDEKEQRVSLTVTRSGDYNSGEFFLDMYTISKNDFKIEVVYTNNDLIQHVDYFIIGEGKNDTIWEKIFFIDYCYDEQGNVSLFEKTIFDAYQNQWLVVNRKEYFYSGPAKSTTNNIIKVNNVCIFPNPARHYITVEGGFSKESSYSIYKLNGTCLISGELNAAPIDVSGLKPGMFIIKVFAERKIFTGRFIRD